MHLFWNLHLLSMLSQRTEIHISTWMTYYWITVLMIEKGSVKLSPIIEFSFFEGGGKLFDKIIEKSKTLLFFGS